MVVAIRFGDRGSGTITDFAKTSLPRYELAVDEIDALVVALFEASAVDFSHLTPLARDAEKYLKKENESFPSTSAT